MFQLDGKISLVLLAFLIILIVVCILKNGFIEKFIVTVDETVLGPNCPDYVVSDGYKFYLVWNNKVFDGINNPISFNTKAQVAAELSKRKCPNMIQNIVYLRRETNHEDPQVSYERACNVQTSAPLNAVNKCISNKIFEIPGQSTMLTAKELASLRPEEIQALEKSRILARTDISEEERTEQLDKLRRGLKGEVSQAYEYVKKVNNAIAGMDTGDLVNYDVETCMFDKLSKDDPNLGSPEGLQKFRRYYNQKAAELSTGRPVGQDRADVLLDKDSLKEFDKYFNEANDLSITNEMVSRIFGDTTD